MVSKGFPNVITTSSGRQYNIGEKPSVVLYTTYINLHTVVSHIQRIGCHPEITLHGSTVLYFQHAYFIPIEREAHIFGPS